MNMTDRVVRNISDTASWVAYLRAQESQRPDALFHDPYAKGLAGERGSQIANALRDGAKHQWAWAARTYLFDKFVSRAVKGGCEVVLNLAAGLDTRPYRLDLPSTLLWVEADLPQVISYKERALAGENARCRLERIELDLSDLRARQQVFADLNRAGLTTVVMAEGLLIYLDAEEVGSLADDLAACEHFGSWIVDLVSPCQLRLMQRGMGKQLGEAGAPFRFGPIEGPDFFARSGWKTKEVCGFLRTAAELKRLPGELYCLLPEPEGVFVNYPWSGLCVLERDGGTQT